MSIDVTGLDILLRVLRKHGVSKFKDATASTGIELELESISNTLDVSVPAVPEANLADLDTCKCGCPTYAHQGGLCIKGCAVEACAPKE